jgi:hypothetical protein
MTPISGHENSSLGLKQPNLIKPLLGAKWCVLFQRIFSAQEVKMALESILEFENFESNMAALIDLIGFSTFTFVE